MIAWLSILNVENGPFVWLGKHRQAHLHCLINIKTG